MIKFSNAILTDLGEQLLVRATVEQPVNFTHLLFSSDSINQDGVKSLTEMNSKQSVPISQVELNGNHVEINALFSNKGVNEGYYLRAIGLYANDDEGNDILIAVAIENSGECYIESENTPIGAIIQIFLKLEDTQKVNLTINPLGSASLLDIKNIKDSMNTHIEDENNPHNITKETLGLGNVENVSVNNQTPTFLEADARENIVSGEKLSSIFGKIKKWFSDLKTVAFTGSYNDLTNRPDIPTVGNGTVTIMQNNAQKGTFSMNQSDNITIELTDTNTDTNTWRPVQDNLTSQSTEDSLSANMGYQLANGDARDGTKLPAEYFHWSGQNGQPAWLWGGNDPNNYYVYNPANFNVNRANALSQQSYGSFAEIPVESLSKAVSVFYSGADPNAPETDTNVYWWNVLQFGEANRLTQIASGAYHHMKRGLYVRTKHDGNWSNWFYIASQNDIGNSGGVSSLRGDVQIRDGLWYKVGRMVTFTIHYYISVEQIGAETNIITGLPTPLGGYWYGLSGSQSDTYMIVNGVLSIRNNRDMGDHIISGSYIC